MVNTEVNQLLNKIVASQGVFYIRLHQFHWYAKGSNFLTLHEKFEELYDAVTADMDEVAEQMLIIGGEPYATLAEFIEHSVIKEDVADKDLSEKDMVAAIVADLRTMIELYDEGIKITDETGDFPTNDILIELKAAAAKQIWLLNAYLGKAATE